MVDGNSLKKVDSNDLLFLEDRRLQITFDPSIRSFHLIFDTTKERRFPLLGFEPTTFLIRVNTKRVLTPKTTVPWLKKLFIRWGFVGGSFRGVVLWPPSNLYNQPTPKCPFYQKRSQKPTPKKRPSLLPNQLKNRPSTKKMDFCQIQQPPKSWKIFKYVCK